MSLLRKCSASADTWYVCPHGSSAVRTGGPLAAGQASGRSAKPTRCVSSCRMLQRAGASDSAAPTEYDPHALRHSPARVSSRARLCAVSAARIARRRPLLNACVPR